jgi:pyrroline-5-carboxylate reductase
METASNWAIDAGVDASTARGYIPAMFGALSKQASDIRARNFSDLVIESATPGWLNEQALEIIRSRGAYTSFAEALDSVADRLGIEDSDPED